MTYFELRTLHMKLRTIFSSFLYYVKKLNPCGIFLSSIIKTIRYDIIYLIVIRGAINEK